MPRGLGAWKYRIKNHLEGTTTIFHHSKTVAGSVEKPPKQNQDVLEGTNFHQLPGYLKEEKATKINQNPIAIETRMLPLFPHI